jgi:hypothetical protein
MRISNLDLSETEVEKLQSLAREKGHASFDERKKRSSNDLNFELQKGKENGRIKKRNRRNSNDPAKITQRLCR